MVIRGVHCAICGLLLAGGVIAFECQAGPVGAAEGIDTMSGDAPATTGRPAISLRTKPGEAGIDHTSPEHWAGLEEASTSGMGAISDLLWNDNSAPDSAPASFSGQRGRNANGAQLIFWDAVDGALRMTRDSLFDGGDMATFTVAGIEVSVALKSRTLSVSGHDMSFAASAPTVPGADIPATAGPVQVAAAPQGLGPGSDISIAKIHEYLAHPFTIFIACVSLGLWVFVQLWRVVRQRPD